MAPKLSIIFLLYLSNSISQRFFVAATPTYLVTTGYLTANHRIIALYPFEKDPPQKIHVCNGTLSDFPGEIAMKFSEEDGVDKEIHCTWILEAPESYRAYVRDLQLIRSSKGRPTPLRDAFNDAPVVEVYDGSTIDLNKRLYWAGNSTLNDCISSNQTLTIDLHYRILKDYSEEKLIINYGIIPDSLLHLRDIATFADI